MSIIWADFPSGQHGLYSNTASYMLNGVYAQLIEESSVGTTDIVNDPDPLIGSNGSVFRTMASSNGTGREAARIALPSPQATEGFTFRIWLAELPINNDNGPFVSFNTVGNSTLFAIRILSNGAIEARNAYTNTGTQYGVTSGPVVSANSYNHIEIKGFANASTGTIEVRVNGTVVLNLTGLNTGTGPIGQIIFGHYVSAYNPLVKPYVYWKDLVFWDTTGSSNNDFLGSVTVYDLLTDVDVAMNWGTSSGSTGWNLINESPPVDTSYIFANGTPPAASIFGLTTLPDDVTSVKALLPIYRAIKTDGGDCKIQVSLSPNGTDWADGADRAITTAFTYWWDVSSVSPDTGVAWSVSEVNTDLTVKFNRTL